MLNIDFDNLLLSRGFSLLELMVVLTLISLISSLVAPRFVSNIERWNFLAERQLIAQQLLQLPRRVKHLGRNVSFPLEFNNVSEETSLLKQTSSGLSPNISELSRSSKFDPESTLSETNMTSQAEQAASAVLEREELEKLLPLANGWKAQYQPPLRISAQGTCSGSEITLFPPQAKESPIRLQVAAISCQISTLIPSEE